MLNVVEPDKAREIIRNITGVYTEKETVALPNSVGRVLAEDVISPFSIPPFDRSTVDGYAVNARDTFGSSETVPVVLKIIGRIGMGESTDLKLSGGECCEIATGAMLPQGSDAVVMVEYTEEDCEDVLIMKAVSPLENITKKGDDIKERAVVFKRGTVINAVSAGMLASLGIKEVKVAKKLNVGVISTGDELLSPGETAAMGKIYDTNSYLVSALSEEFGCVSRNYGIVRDDYDSINNAVMLAVDENDIVLLSGGSSAGRHDMTADIIAESGEVFIHGLAMKPGKPTIIGKIKEKPVIGLPGHPAASFFVCEAVIRPAIEHYYRISAEKRSTVCEISCNVSSNHGREELIAVRINDGIAEPILAKSGILSNLAKADGYIVINRNLEGLKKGDTVNVTLF